MSRYSELTQALPLPQPLKYLVPRISDLGSPGGGVFCLLYNCCMSSRQPKFSIGIDEVGRGPLAGPVAVGALFATHEVIRKFKEIKESKQLTPRQRDEWYAQICDAKGECLGFTVSFVSAHEIDRRGIAPAIRKALARAIRKLKVQPEDCHVLLDGGLRAPEEYRSQRTIIRGDATHTVIAMASVVAKVLRDRKMVRLDKKYPRYGLAVHKGYGTKTHVRAIKTLGPSAEHRRTFLRRII